MMDEINSYIHYHEYDTNKRHPTLVIQGCCSSSGYDVDPVTLELTSICICYANNEYECICNYDWSK